MHWNPVLVLQRQDPTVDRASAGPEVNRGQSNLASVLVRTGLVLRREGGVTSALPDACASRRTPRFLRILGASFPTLIWTKRWVVLFTWSVDLRHDPSRPGALISGSRNKPPGLHQTCRASCCFSHIVSHTNLPPSALLHHCGPDGVIQEKNETERETVCVRGVEVIVWRANIILSAMQ